MQCRYALTIIFFVMSYGCNSRNFSEVEQCKAITSYIGWEVSELIDEQLVFGTSDINWDVEHPTQTQIEQFVEMDWLDLREKSPWSQDIPYKSAKKTLAEKQLLRSFLQNPKLKNAVTVCPSLQQFLRKNSVMIGQNAIERVIAQKDGETNQYPRSIAAQSMPVLSDDGQSAMMFASRVYAGLAGGGLIIKIERRPSGEWQPTRAQVVWIS